MHERAASSVERRDSARVLLFDDRDRLLLFRWVDPRLAVPHLWIAPGGGVEPGERWEDAALRELSEETGLAGVALGPCVWVRRAVVDFDGGPLDCVERFYVVRVSRHDVDVGGMQLGEAAYLDGVHWWSTDELARADGQHFAPRELPALVPPLIAGALPPAPLALGL